MQRIVITYVLLQHTVLCFDKNVILQHIEKKATDNDSWGVNETCRIHLQRYLIGLNNSETWALEMLDSSGRIPRGLMKGHIMDMGFFDECLDISEETEDGDIIKGRFCNLGLAVPLTLDNTTETDNLPLNVSDKVASGFKQLRQFEMVKSTGGPITELPSYMLMAVCLPDSCFPSEIFGQLGNDGMCTTKGENSAWDAGDITFAVFFGITVAFLALSTSYDVYIQKVGIQPIHRILLAFSVYSNGRKILEASNTPGQIASFNGMKAISLFWVIAGHRYSMLEAIGIINPTDAQEWKNRWYAAYILVAPLSVDTFLFITGALLAHLFLKSMNKPNARLNIGLYYIHRYLRLTPALIILWFLQVTAIRRLGSGPLWNGVFEMFRQICIDNWWQFFLYIHNYFDFDQRCMNHTWYLSLDMQLFILSPLLLLPLIKYPRIARNVILPLSIAASILCAMIVIYAYDVRYFSASYDKYYYYKTHNRAGPWLIGIAFGAFALRGNVEKRTFHIRQVINLAIWGLVLTLMAIIIFYQRVVIINDNRTESAVYMGLQRPLWALCLCWISFACTYGYGGIINWFLSLPIFQVISKISYSVYLVHFFVLMASLGHMRVPIYFDDYNALYIVCTDIMFSLVVGAFWTLAFESPMITIEKVIFGGGRRSQTQKKTNNLEEGKRCSDPASGGVFDMNSNACISSSTALEVIIEDKPKESIYN